MVVVVGGGGILQVLPSLKATGEILRSLRPVRHVPVKVLQVNYAPASGGCYLHGVDTAGLKP